MLDRDLVPQGLEEGVGEAQGEQVLDRFLAEIMIYAQHVLFAEAGGETVVDCLAALEIIAQWLFDNDPRARTNQASLPEIGAKLAVEAGRGGEIVEHVTGGADARLERSKACSVGGIDLGMNNAGFDRAPARLIEPGPGIRLQRSFDLPGESLVAQVSTRAADDNEVFRQEPVGFEKVE